MNFKKYILGLLAILFLSVPSFAEKQVFLGEGKVLVSGAGNRFIRSIDDFKLNDVADLKEDIKHFDVLNKS